MKKKQTIQDILFWRRNPTSVEQIERLSLTWKEDHFHLLSPKEEKDLTPEESQSLLDTLFKSWKLEEIPEEYKAFLYEDDTSNFSLKFFLRIDSINHTYLAIKGILPFKQEHYNDILNLFVPYLEK